MVFRLQIASVINMIAGKHITQTSNNAVGCTFRSQCYQVLLDNFSVNLWDTRAAGLDEGTEGIVPAKQAESSLFVKVMHSTTTISSTSRYLCRKKVPVALVVTGLENYEGNMEGWWIEHEKDLMKHGMRFDAHACVTPLSKTD
ncbi:hypothetical protein V8E55_004535 [Tylopilus felleus]